MHLYRPASKMTFRAMDQVVSSWPLAVKVRVLSPDIPREICVAQWHWERFLYQYFNFPLSVSYHQCSIHHYFNTIPIRAGWQNVGTSTPSISRNTEQKAVFTLFCCNVFVHRAKYLLAS
jgi:hypothetical protein